MRKYLWYIIVMPDSAIVLFKHKNDLEIYF